MKYEIGDIFKIGIGTYNIDTGKNDSIVEAEIIEIRKGECLLEMTEVGGPFQVVSNLYLTEDKRV